MNIIPRLIQPQVESRFFKGKILVIYGARQVGKTTLTKQILEKYPHDGLYLNCEILSTSQILTDAEPSNLRHYFGNKKLIVLDEAQKIKNIGLVLKTFVDTYPEIQIIATGSSSFELANQTGEPLTGRVDRFVLHPLSVEEVGATMNSFEIESRLENFLIFGSYPEVFFLSEAEAKNRLDEISSNYLYRDILAFERLKKAGLLTNLLQLLALQIGSEVSLNELSNKLGVSRVTVQKYLDILEQSFVIFTLKAFSRNLRKEIAKSVKIYFFDLGIRNSLIQNFNRPALRTDIGGMWENFLIAERIKKCAYHQIHANRYFWRTYDQKEIDYIEDRDGKLYAYEFKWGAKKASKPKDFFETYKGSEFNLITTKNYLDFI